MERRSTPRLLRRPERRHPGVGSVGVCHRGCEHRKSPRQPCRPRRTKSNTRTPRSCSSARAARARRGFPSGWLERLGTQRLDGRRVGDAVEAARVFRRRRRAGNLALGFRRPGGPAVDPPALHGRNRAGGAGLRRPEGRPVRDAGPVGPRSHPRLAQSRSPSCWSPGAWMPAACASAGARSKLREGARLPRLSGNQRQGQHRLRGTQAGHPRRHPVGEHSVALLAAALQAAQGGDRPPQGRRPGADALQRTARDAATALCPANSRASPTRN